MLALGEYAIGDRPEAPDRLGHVPDVAPVETLRERAIGELVGDTRGDGGGFGEEAVERRVADVPTDPCVRVIRVAPFATGIVYAAGQSMSWAAS